MMKSIIFLIFCLSVVYAGSSKDLENCYNERHAQFFVSDQAGATEEGWRSVALLNDRSEVVGAVYVEVETNDFAEVTSLKVRKVSLCSRSIEVDEFYYADGESEDLKTWRGRNRKVYQDEGLMLMNVFKLKSKDEYAKKFRVNFKAYDVFYDEDENGDEIDPNSFKGQKDFLEDWGLPKAKGRFFFYLPSKWLIGKENLTDSKASLHLENGKKVENSVPFGSEAICFKGEGRSAAAILRNFLNKDSEKKAVFGGYFKKNDVINYGFVDTKCLDEGESAEECRVKESILRCK